MLEVTIHVWSRCGLLLEVTFHPWSRCGLWLEVTVHAWSTCGLVRSDEMDLHFRNSFQTLKKAEDPDLEAWSLNTWVLCCCSQQLPGAKEFLGC